jgi:2-polyprenyl-3-methyl-5-hydroxy-6-metoxy-1,4-benzoquinol methylase
MSVVKYDKHYREDPAACGSPFAEFEAFCSDIEPGSVLDLGCGQGRDALMFASAGHRVLGVDISSVGIEQMLEVAKTKGLDVQGIVANICTCEPEELFDVVILDRVLHMLDTDARVPVLTKAMKAVSEGGYLLVAEGPKGMTPVRETIEKSGWSLITDKPNRLIAKRL